MANDSVQFDTSEESLINVKVFPADFASIMGRIERRYKKISDMHKSKETKMNVLK